MLHKSLMLFTLPLPKQCYIISVTLKLWVRYTQKRHDFKAFGVVSNISANHRLSHIISQSPCSTYWILCRWFTIKAYKIRKKINCYMGNQIWIFCHRCKEPHVLLLKKVLQRFHKRTIDIWRNFMFLKRFFVAK